jgi:hypothetical protein
MSIVSFHRALIVVAILFCFGYGVWELTGYAQTDRGGSLGLGVVFVVLGGGLVFYLLRLSRFLGYEGEGGPDGRSP